MHIIVQHYCATGAVSEVFVGIHYLLEHIFHFVLDT